MEQVALRIAGMSERHPGLSRAVAASYCEAAQVCLARHHQPPTTFRLQAGEDAREAVVEWELPPDRARAAWANQTAATESGASALVLAAVEEALGLVAFSRAETRSGADYLMVPANASSPDLESAVRLEISGVDRGPPRLVYERVRRKIEQVLRGTGELPALVGVAGLSSRRIVLETVEGAE
jgi:hypothetical protein